ncbi:lipase family protein [Priestia flexa]|uniref:lipase family protein n=1 Tax=Priestia flexa TaxID=86664 RepID=UPI001F1A2EC3|nr:lipase family protein [Priestia flexa]UIR30966.1 lipase family protein [Priestia flexa]
MKKVTNKMSAEQYNEMSSSAYDITHYKSGAKVEVGNEVMYVVDYTTDNEKGTNAITLVSEEDYFRSQRGQSVDRIENIYIAYRGSEPMSKKQWGKTVEQGVEDDLGAQLAAHLKERYLVLDGIDKVNGSVTEKASQIKGSEKYAVEVIEDWVNQDLKILIGQKKFVDVKNSQPQEGSKYAVKMHEKYKNADVRVTGHSLGGTVASYVVVDNDFVKQGVTFENPNAYANLTKDLQEKAKNGDYRERLTEYINLNDGLSLLNRHFPELGKVVVMWDKQKESVNMTDTLSGNVLRSDTIRSTLIDKFGSDVGNFLADQLGDVADEADEVMTSSVNEGLQSQNASLNYKLFLEAVLGGSHGLNRYSFHKDGSVITLEEKLHNNPALISAMLAQAEGANMSNKGASVILLKVFLLDFIANKLTNHILNSANAFTQAVKSIEQQSTQAALETKSLFVNTVGFGEYDLLSAGDVEEVFQELAQSHDKGDALFLDVQLYEEAVQSAEKLQGEVSQAGDFTRYLVKMMTEKDETLAASIAAK